MPVYSFRCTKCAREFDVNVPLSASDGLDPLCFEDGCDGKPTERLLRTGGFVLKGEGWARDGYSKR